jgi:hypothetical protein
MLSQSHFKNPDDIVPYSIIISPRNSDFFPAIYQEQRNVPFLHNPSDYYCAVTGLRFDISNIPFMRFPNAINPGMPSDPNYSNLWFTMIYSPAPAVYEVFQNNVIYVPSTVTSPPILVEANSTNHYYDIYDPPQMVKLINNTINKSFAQLLTLHPGLSPAVTAPFFNYNAVDGKLSLFVPNVINPLVPGVNVYETQYDINNKPLFGSTQPAGTIQLYFNIGLDKILGYFNSYFTDNFQSEYLYMINPAPNATGAYFEFIQSDNFVSTNSIIARLAIISNSLPILDTYIPVTTDNPVGINSKIKIVFDLYPSKDIFNDGPSVNYNQQGFLRLHDMAGRGDFAFLDLEFVYIDHQQNFNQIFISQNDCCAISLIFIKKSLFKNI